MIPPTSEHCVATVTDASYLPGTLVLLSSFLRRNPWFEGDIVIIQQGLPDHARRRLSRFRNVRFHDVGPALTARLAAVAARHPALERKLPIFFSLEAFNLPAYRRVVKLDGDLVCLGDATPLFEHDGAFLACPDQAYFWGRVRDARTYVPRLRGATETDEHILPATFNSGVLVLSPSDLPASIYDELLVGVGPDIWKTIRTGHTDSVVLNQRFRGVWKPLSERFNYLISHEMVRYTRPRVALGQAVFLHLLGRPKPWEGGTPRAPLTDDHRYALNAWHEAWNDASASRSTGGE
jgi:lipopolysaccharide biosynthesis glycosyltransferase